MSDAHGFPTLPPPHVLIETRTLPPPFQYVGWRLWSCGESLWLRTFVHTVNSRTGEPMTQFGGSTRAHPENLQSVIRDTLVDALAHEVDELLTFDGVRPFNPHADQERDPPDREMRCLACPGMTVHRFQPSPEAGPFWRCSECGEPATEEWFHGDTAAERFERLAASQRGATDDTQ